MATVKKLFCPKCGDEAEHKEDKLSEVGGTVGVVGAAAIMKVGTGIGVAMFGTAFIGSWVVIPVLGVASFIAGRRMNRPKCQKCGARFSVS